MLYNILIFIAVILGAFLAYIAFQSPKSTIARELFIRSTPEKLFPFINSSKKAQEWMPWQDSDPSVKMTYAGPEFGVGSVASWDSPGKMGAGKAEIIESSQDKFVKTQLTNTRPMEMSQLAELSLTPKDGGTLVRWSVTGENNFICRVFCFFMNIDKMVGGEFEKGLLKLKGTVE